ncbi:MAG: hypothetical protein M1840_003489 [Geoglossum simile]|nr:MAG: hypothetical protein M1840_003489 [Geoglossum simile]
MSENAPLIAPPAPTEPARGTPYYEELRRKLRESLLKKRVLDKTLANLEDQIFRFENSYLEETTAGNIIRGFDSYIKGSSASSSGGAGSSSAGGAGAVGGSRRRALVNESDRVFSRSSSTYLRDSPAPTSSTQTTPSHHTTPSASTFPQHHASNQPTPTSATTFANAAGNSHPSSTKNPKKKRASIVPLSAVSVTGGGLGDDIASPSAEDGKGPKRVRISFGGGGN